jgi:hypothetical protein
VRIRLAKASWDDISDYGRRSIFCRNKGDLAKQLAELKHDLLTLRVQKIAGGSAAKLTKMFVLPLASVSIQLWMGEC